MSPWIPKPAGKFGHIRIGPDGHLYAGTERIRFFGTNLAFGACFPDKPDAERIAARMAKFGINIVRFHHMDTNAFPEGIRARNTPSTRDLDPDALDRLDYFISQLRRNGIYVNLNLLVSRPFKKADGLPAEIEQLQPKQRGAVGFYYEPIQELQREYATKLLTHRNPYTGMTYAEDPSIAFVEITNENGLVSSWLKDWIEGTPGIFQKVLQSKWNGWLRSRYGTTESIRQSWKEEPSGDNLMVNTDFSRGLESWVLEQTAPAKASAVVTDETPNPVVVRQSACTTVAQSGLQDWDTQFSQPRIKVQAGRRYELAFWAKADKPCTIMVSIGRAHSPWGSLGFSTSVQLTGQWQQFRFLTLLTDSDDNARVNFSCLARQVASYWFANPSLRPAGAVQLGDGEQIEKDSVPVFTRTRFEESVLAAKRDWLRFLLETENAYWQALFSHLKNNLRSQSLVVGTDIACSTPNVMANLESVDTHGYWEHPIFPGTAWDENNWIVPNLSMVNEAGGTLPSLSARRVFGKPYAISEYNHPSPNTFGSEGFLLLAAYAALQDWDAIYSYNYSERSSDDWDLRRIPDFFGIDQHPTKMVSLVPAVSMFSRGNVRAAQDEIVAIADREREIDEIWRSQACELGRSYGFFDARNLGVPPAAALLHRVSIVAEGQNTPSSALSPNQVSVTGNRFVSDTGELIWDLTVPGRGLVTLNTAKSKAIIGYCGSKRLDLGGVVFEPGETLQQGWSAITLTALEGELSSRPIKSRVRLVVTATGYAENTNMGWKNTEKSTVGRDWGVSPSLVEGISARITLPLPATEVQAWALDERGQRKTQVPMQRDGNGNAVVVIGPQWQTLWYEVTSSGSTMIVTSMVSTSITTSSTSTARTSTSVSTYGKFSTTSTTIVTLLQRIRHLQQPYTLDQSQRHTPTEPPFT
jgi:hypothetical protein